MRDRRQTAMVVALSLLATSVFAIGACANSLTITAPTANAKCLFSPATPGTKDITCKATVVPDTLEGPGWSHPSGVPDGTTASWPGPSGNSGRSVTLRLTGLPTYNDPPGLNNGLGDFEIKAGIPDSPCGVIWKFVTVHLFYPADATNHPGAGSGTTRNWYYYWEQTTASSGAHHYVNTNAWFGQYIGGEDHFHIGNPASGDNPETGHDGIDTFAETCIHEDLHMTHWNCWNGLPDADGEWLPDCYEDANGNGVYDPPTDPSDWQDADTDNNGTDDEEELCYQAEHSWTEGFADSQDWASPGHQWN